MIYVYGGGCSGARRRASAGCGAPVREATARFGVHKSLVSKWAAQEVALRRAVLDDGTTPPTTTTLTPTTTLRVCKTAVSKKRPVLRLKVTVSVMTHH